MPKWSSGCVSTRARKAASKATPTARKANRPNPVTISNNSIHIDVAPPNGAKTRVVGHVQTIRFRPQIEYQTMMFGFAWRREYTAPTFQLNWQSGQFYWSEGEPVDAMGK
jgi:hypothetical protein